MTADDVLVEKERADPEIAALGKLATILLPFDRITRRRMLRWAWDAMAAPESVEPPKETP